MQTFKSRTLSRYTGHSFVSAQVKFKDLNKQRKNTIIAILIVLFMNQTLFEYIAAFLPLYASRAHPTMGGTQMGFLVRYLSLFDFLSMFEIANIATIPFLTPYMKVIGRKNAITIGNILMVRTRNLTRIDCSNIHYQPQWFR